MPDASWAYLCYAKGYSPIAMPVRNPMRLYYEVALRAFRRATTYRVAALAGLITNAFFGALFSLIYIAVYKDHTSMAGYSVREAVSYLWITQSLISIGSAWVSGDLTRSIRTGDVAVDLMRPWNFYTYWLSQQLGDKCFNLVLRGSLTYLVGILYFHVTLPTVFDFAFFLLSVLFAMLISSAFNFLINASAFWLIDNSGLVNIASIVTMFFSGFLIPLAFFPDWLQPIAAALPFQATTSIPVQLFLGRLQGIHLAEALAIQAFWAILMTTLALILMHRAMRKIVIQGG
jgi:ABC-2 type transport system permease protein